MKVIGTKRRGIPMKVITGDECVEESCFKIYILAKIISTMEININIDNTYTLK